MADGGACDLRAGVAAAGLLLLVLGCGVASDGADAPARRICDGSTDMRLAIGHGLGGQTAPSTAFLHELGSDFLYVDGTCRYWTQEPSSSADPYHSLRPYRVGVLTPDRERELHDAVAYDDFTTQTCSSYGAPLDAGSGFLWDGQVMYYCGVWDIRSDWPLRAELYQGGTDVQGPMRILVARTTVWENQPLYQWPLEAPIAQYATADGQARSFRIDDAAAVTALRALRARATADPHIPGYFTKVIAIAPREAGIAYVLTMRDELSFADADGRWRPPSATSP